MASGSFGELTTHTLPSVVHPEVREPKLLYIFFQCDTLIPGIRFLDEGFHGGKVFAGCSTVYVI